MFKFVLRQIVTVVAGWLMPHLTRELRKLARSVVMRLGPDVFTDRETRKEAADELEEEARKRGLNVARWVIEEAISWAMELLGEE